MTRNRLRSVACLVAALAMAGCSGESTDSKGGGDSKTVTVLTHDSFNLPKELVKEFDRGRRRRRQSAGSDEEIAEVRRRIRDRQLHGSDSRRRRAVRRLRLAGSAAIGQGV